MRIDTTDTIWKVNYFRNTPVGELFWSNGNKWRKRSTKTAAIVSPDCYAGTWFYFRQNDIVETEYKGEEQ